MISNDGGRAGATSLPVFGSIIGKALEDFNDEDGIIEIVIGRL
jgi:hypothetical protein